MAWVYPGNVNPDLCINPDVIIITRSLNTSVPRCPASAATVLKMANECGYLNDEFTRTTEETRKVAAATAEAEGAAEKPFAECVRG